MAIDHSFIIKKLQGLPEMFVIFSQSTKHPYVTCNEESFDDQIHIFSDAEAAHAYVVAKNEQEKIPVVSVRVAAEQFLYFYGTLYALGVNGVVLHDNDTETSLALETIVHRRHNPDELPEKQRPVINPELMLTSLYFLQEMRRPVSEEEKEKEKADLRAMDEELVANLVRGRFLSGIIVDESEEDAEENTEEVENSDGNTENEKVEDFESDVESKNAEDGKIEESKESETEEEQPKKKKKNNIRVPYVNNQNGEMYQAIFTDGYELQKFDPKKRLRPVVVKFDDLEKFLVKDAKGFVLNPVSTALPLRREQLPAFKKRIDG